MPQVLEQGDIFGRIGKALGEGVGSQLEKSRLASTLEKMQGTELSPPQQAAQLLKAGATSDQVSQFLPLLQQQQQRKAFLQGDVPSQEVKPETPATAIAASPTALGKSFQPLQGTVPALEARARELITAQPSLYMDPNKALAKAQSEYETQQNVLNKTRDEFNAAVEKRLQKYGRETDQAIIGDMQQDYLREAQALAATGKMSPEKAVDKLSKDLLDFAKARTNLKGLTLTSSLVSSIPKKAEQSKLHALRKQYEDNDQLELFENDLINELGLSSGVASYLAYPIKANKEINNFAHDTKRRFSSFFKDITEKGGKGTKKRSEQDIGDFIGKNLKDSDSLISIASTFNAKGYDPQLIIDEIQKNWDEGKIRLSKRQQQDLQKRPSFRPTLRDIAYFAGTGLKPQEIIP